MSVVSVGSRSRCFIVACNQQEVLHAFVSRLVHTVHSLRSHFIAERSVAMMMHEMEIEELMQQQQQARPFRVGDRVRIVSCKDWRTGCIGTIKQRPPSHGSDWWIVELDAQQPQQTEWWHEAHPTFQREQYAHPNDLRLVGTRPKRTLPPIEPQEEEPINKRLRSAPTPTRQVSESALTEMQDDEEMPEGALVRSYACAWAFPLFPPPPPRATPSPCN